MNRAGELRGLALRTDPNLNAARFTVTAVIAACARILRMPGYGEGITV